MEDRMQTIECRNNSKVSIGVIPGHYATNHSHVNYYVAMTSIKTSMKMANEAQRNIMVLQEQHPYSKLLRESLSDRQSLDG